MTEARRQELEEKLNLAEASGDQNQIDAVRKTMNQEYRECTSHTADRLKRVEQTVNDIKNGLIPHDMFDDLKNGLNDLSVTVRELKADIEAWKNRAQGMRLLWKILGFIVAAGGSGWLIKIITATKSVPGLTD